MDAQERERGGRRLPEKLPRLAGGRHGDNRYGGLGVHADKIDGPRLSQKMPLLASWQQNTAVPETSVVGADASRPLPATGLKGPFPAFGGKSRVAALVWERLGDVDNFVEPFANSAAVLLARPTAPRIETLNDVNCYISNFWRATKHDPEAVAEFADDPVNEADLHSRHRWLVLSAESAEFRARMRTEPDYFDARIAGWWCWGACCWIGSGWCDDNTGRAEADGARPYLGCAEGRRGMGVHQGGPSASHRPQLADAYGLGRGVHGGPSLPEKRPSIGGPLHGTKYGQGVHAGNPASLGTCAAGCAAEIGNGSARRRARRRGLGRRGCSWTRRTRRTPRTARRAGRRGCTRATRGGGRWTG
jgi:hypothetical protein